MLENLDFVAKEMEVRWGEGMLEILADEDLKIRFQRQQKKLNAAIESNDKDVIDKTASAMIRGWRTLEQNVRVKGHKPKCETVWIGEHNDGTKVCVYSRDSNVAHIESKIPSFHIDELVRLIDPQVLRIKGHFPDSEITRVKKDDDWYETGGDEIPF